MLEENEYGCMDNYFKMLQMIPTINFYENIESEKDIENYFTS